MLIFVTESWIKKVLAGRQLPTLRLHSAAFAQMQIVWTVRTTCSLLRRACPTLTLWLSMESDENLTRGSSSGHGFATGRPRAFLTSSAAHWCCLATLPPNVYKSACMPGAFAEHRLFLASRKAPALCECLSRRATVASASLPLSVCLHLDPLVTLAAWLLGFCGPTPVADAALGATSSSLE